MPTPSNRAQRIRGMSLIEALVTLLLFSLIVIAFLSVLDATSRVAKIQGNFANSTEDLRLSMAALVRITRMAGTGGLPIVVPGSTGFVEVAVEVTDNTTSADRFGGKTAVAGTDVLRIRGVIAGDLFEIIGAEAIDFGTNTLILQSRSPYLGRDQALVVPSFVRSKPLILLLQRPFGITTSIGGTRHYSAFRLLDTTDSLDAVSTPTPPDMSGIRYMTVRFTTNGDSAALNPGGSFSEPDPALIYYAGFVDDMRFFIAENAFGEKSLYRFRGSGHAEELVPNIVNLQVALGCDVDRDGVLRNGEWFCSRATPGFPSPDQMNSLREVRISLVARTQDKDNRWVEHVEMPENSALLSYASEGYRHRVMTVCTGLRSHPALEDS